MTSPPVGRPMQILMAEDNLTDARLAIEALKRGGIKHHMTLVVDGEEAIAFLRREGRFASAPRPDLILLDLTLPKKDGRQLLEEIKADEDLKTIPVVVLTASDNRDDYLRSQALKVDAYMIKPVNLEKFLDVVAKLKRFWLADVIVPERD